MGASLWLEFNFLWRILGFVSATALLLSLSGIDTVMAFTVSRRTREIGIRMALGVVAAIFARAVAQVGIGIAAGGGLVFLLTRAVSGLSAREVAMVAAYMMVMMGVACSHASFRHDVRWRSNRRRRLEMPADDETASRINPA